MKLKNNAVYGKIVGSMRNKVDVRLVGNKKYYLKCTSKSSYMSQKTFGNDLIGKRKSKVILTLNKRAYVWMCILNLSKTLI